MSGDDPGPHRLAALLLDREETIAVAESCTGGLLGAEISSVPGASEYFIGGVITYMIETKLHLLAISREALETHGPVSAPVAREMAQHVRDETGADWGISTTGYAGPTGGSSPEPVGSVYIGIASTGGSDRPPETWVTHHRFEGDRSDVRHRISRQAIVETVRAIGGSSGRQTVGE